MFRPKRTIPKLTVAFLAIAGCGDSSGGGGSNGTAGAGGDPGTGGVPGTGGNNNTGATGGDGVPSLSEALQAAVDAFCIRRIDCIGGNPVECVNDYARYYGDYAFMEGCEEALVSYFSCMAELPCGSDDDPCGSESMAATDACPTLNEGPF